MRRHLKGTIINYLLLLGTVVAALTLFGCEGDRGANGTSIGTVSGQITDTGGNKLAGITVTPTPAVTGVTPAQSDANGNYTLNLPSGNYTLTFARPGYASQSVPVNVIATQTATQNVTLTQTSAAVVNVAPGTFTNGTATLSATALVNAPNLQGQPATFTWTDAQGNVLGTGPSLTVNQPTTAQFKSAIANLQQVRMGIDPPGANEQADENHIDVASLQPLDRFQVVGISLQNFRNAALTPIRVRAAIGFQNFSTVQNVSSATNTLPFVPNNGLRNVAVGQPVLVQGKSTTTGGAAQTSYSWTLTPAPGSNLTTANLQDATTRLVSFIPDAAGKYTLTETVSGLSMNIYAGHYVGILSPAANNAPGGVVNPSCTTSCHNTGAAATSFNTPFKTGQFFSTTTDVNTVFSQWALSGHAQALVHGLQAGRTFNVATSAPFQSVGFSQFSGATRSGGFSDVSQATGFNNTVAQQNAPNFFVGNNQALALSNVQCENCHGPNEVAHNTGDPDAISSRFSLASDVCGTCHTDRFGEWAGSGHGDFETGMDEGLASGGNAVNANCGGCHTGQGYGLFIQQLESGNPLRTLTAANQSALNTVLNGRPATSRDTVQPQTCVVCHQAHNVGNSGANTLTGFAVVLRGDFQPGGAFAGSTPLLPAGFQANGVGMGALCITCHNSRNGGVGTFPNGTATLHEDADVNFDPAAAPTAYLGVPHEACQGDVLMGRNAYFFSGPNDITLPGFTKIAQTGQRSAHSFIADTCVTCHMEIAKAAGANQTSDFPFGIGGGGTNHTFAIANDPTKSEESQINAICNACHGSSFQGTGVQASFDAAYNTMLKAIANAILRVKFGSAGAIPAGTTLTFIPGRTPSVSVNGATSQSLASYLASAPGTANTGAIPASGVQRDLSKANWNAGLVAPGYVATAGGSSFDNGTAITGGTNLTTTVAGDQSRAIHNPSFVFNVMQVTTARMNAL